MDAKKLFLMLTIGLLAVNCASAGETTVKGTASCVMPDFFELQVPAAVQGTSVPAIPAAPVPAGASGDYEVQKEDKLIQTQENQGTVTVYTVCAK